jgi:hypothetical protein
LHGMAYYIFLKSLRSLEEFRKNPHIKIPHKSLCTNFQSLGKFKNPIFILKIISLQFWPSQPSHPVSQFGLLARSAHHGLFFLLSPKTEERLCRRLPSPSSAAPASPTVESMPRAPHRIRQPSPLPSSFCGLNTT